MGNVSILDCTLRDGGYINQWKFGKTNITKIIEGIEESGVEIVECGFLKDIPFDEDSSLYPNEIEMSQAFHKKRNTMYVGMIALGDVDPNTIGPRTSEGIDGIRLTFHKPDLEEEFAQAEILMKKGYEVFIQPVGTTTYSDSELIELIKRINQLHPFAFYIVDTLGIMYPEDIQRLYSIVNHNLDSNIKIGFHSHNNLQLSFANAQLFISEGFRREGGVIIDSSIFGMGRGAGNLATELITQYINKTYGQMYNPIPLLAVADRYLNQIYMATPWGYSTPYYLSAVNNCHPNYSNYLLTKKTLDIEDIAKILNLLPDDSKELYDKKLIESLYIDYQKSNTDDTDDLNELKHLFEGKEILVIAAGKSVPNNIDKINDWAKSHDCMIVHINTIREDIPADILFISNAKKARSWKSDYPDLKTIISSNIHDKTVKPDYVVDYSSLLGNNSELDNAGLMFLTLLARTHTKKVTLAGYDGFTYDPADYLEFVSGSYLQRDLDHKNAEISRELWRLSKLIDISFLTPTLYTLEANHQ